jgi:hypothetical protein
MRNPVIRVAFDYHSEACTNFRNTLYQFPTTGALIEALKTRPTLRRLCGWESAADVPSEATFRRAFAAFAADQLPQRVHENMVQVHAGPKLVGHVSRDATALEAPERPAPKPATAPKVPRKRGRPKKGEERPAPPPSDWKCNSRVP